MMNTGQRKDPRKSAFVLSGGANRGALEAGALLALFENDIKPDILVGSSVGAINATAIALDPSLKGAQWLVSVWREVAHKNMVLPVDYLAMAWRFVSGESGLASNKRLREFLQRHIPRDIKTYGDIKGVDLYVTAVNIETGELHIFGIDKSESVLDGMMASSAVPAMLSPWQYRGQLYVDGGVASDLPLRVAIDRGATEACVIDVGERRTHRHRVKSAVEIVKRVVEVASYQRFLDEVGLAREKFKGDLHYINIDAFDSLKLWDFSRTEEMIRVGRETTLEYLEKNGLSGNRGGRAPEDKVERVGV